jgi:peroxiredoxin
MIGVMGAALAAPTVGQMAPIFGLTLLDGRAISLGDFKGKPVVVNFWHSG